MSNLQFPSEMTEEEMMLKTKYAQLNKKKKAVNAIVSLKPKPELFAQIPTTSVEARQNRNKAVELIKSGTITMTKTPKREGQPFKRPRGQERKSNSSEAFYQPFSAIQGEEEFEAKKSKVIRKNDSFTPAKDKVAEKPPHESKWGSRETYSIYVAGDKPNISKDFLMEHFSRFGETLLITAKSVKSGFVTFKDSESADRAIDSMDKKIVSSTTLRVSVSNNEPNKNATSKDCKWVFPAENYSKRGNRKHGRELVSYDENTFNDNSD